MHGGPCQGSVAFWALSVFGLMSVTGLEEMTPSQPSVRFRLEMLPFPSGRGAGDEGSHSRLLASARIGRSSDYLIIGQEEKSTAFFRFIR